MKTRFVIAPAIAIACMAASTSMAQLPNLGGGAAGANNSARAQAQARQRVQAQVQQRATAAAQARIQADAARAAHIAQQAAAMAQRQAEIARRQAAAGANARVGADVSANNQIRAGGVSAQARTNLGLGIKAGLLLPPGLTEADVHIYDEIFGRFNPLRPQPEDAPEPTDLGQDLPALTPTDEDPTALVSEEITPPVSDDPLPPASDDPLSPLSDDPLPPISDDPLPPVSDDPLPPVSDDPLSPEPEDPNEPSTEPPQDDSSFAARGKIDLMARLEIAMRQRRAQISELRDHAVETGNAALLLQAERMEESLNAFMVAKARLVAQRQAAAAERQTRPFPPVSQGQFNGQGQVRLRGTTDDTENPLSANAQPEGSVTAEGANDIR